VSLEEDLARRDFTINAMAYHPLRREWRDPFGGQRDAAARLIRAVGDPGQRFREDYLRILRALRFSARFDFPIETETWKAALGSAPGLAHLSAERVRDEWFKGLQTARSALELANLWVRSGAARIWIPELETGPFSAGKLSEPPPTQRDPVILTALLTGHSSPVLRRLKASGAEIERAERLESGPEQPEALDERSVRRWLSVTGSAADDLASLWMLRHQREAPWAKTMDAIRRRGDPLTRSNLAITGSDLQALGAKGPEIGRTLALLLERVLEEPALNTREHLLSLARELQ
jgi:tRNA nucleotidyltransferase (CCA-adding enzyme)